MSRSFKKEPIGSWCGAPSEKKDKKQWHSRARSEIRRRIMSDEDPHLDDREVSNLWTMAKDGKCYFGDGPEMKKYMRK